MPRSSRPLAGSSTTARYCRGWKSNRTLQSIPHWQIAECYSPVERAVLAYTDGMVLQGGRVAEGIFAALKKYLSDVEIMELTYIVGMYDMHAMISKALRLEYDDVDDRIVEVAAPSGAASNDVMRMVDTEKKTE